MSEDPKAPIHLTLLNGTGFVFDVEDYIYIRQHYRIIGAMVGTTSQKGWPAGELTMPVSLSIYETRLLIDERVAVLVSKKQSLLRSPTAIEIAQSKQQFEINLKQQREAMRNKRLSEVQRNMDKILDGKRKKLMKTNNIEACENLTPAAVLDELGKSFSFCHENALVNIPMGHDQSHTGSIVEPPNVNKFKYEVFRDLWRQGYFVTGGDTFGADFLAYPGDPMLYHSAHIVILLPESDVMPLRLIAKARLSVTVNKNCVFAYQSADTDSKQTIIKYQTFYWDGSYNDD